MTRNPLVSAAGACREAERALQDGKAPSGEPVTITATGAARPLAGAISRTLHAIRETLAGTAPGQKTHDAAEAPRRLLAADAFSNPEYVHFAFKVTLAVMILLFRHEHDRLAGHPTCVITAFFVALGTVGETLHKATLRFVGCLIGAGLGLGAILLLMPSMTDLGDLLLLLAPVTLARRLGRLWQRAHLLCRLADRARLLSRRAAGLWPNDRHVHREGPHHRHPVRQYRGLRDIHDDLAGERGQCRAHEPRQGVRATGGAGGFGCPNRWRDSPGRSVRGRRSLWAGDRAGARGPGQRSVRNEARCGALSGGGRSTRLWWSRSVGCSSPSRRSSICVPIWPGTIFRSQCTTRSARITRRWRDGFGGQRHGRAAAREQVRWQPVYRNRRPYPARVITSRRSRHGTACCTRTSAKFSTRLVRNRSR